MRWTVLLVVAACGVPVTPGVDAGGDDPTVDAGAHEPGSSCSVASDCTSGACVDGVCCERACDGVCEACAASKTGGADGVCAPVRADTDPDDECTAASGSCETGLCGGSRACGRVADGAICRASTGTCDVEERCNIDACPADALAAPTQLCRAAGGVCDVEERCTGSDVECPADVLRAATTECRSASGVCDVAESCTGVSAACPADQFAGAAVTCRSEQGVCDVAETCSGASASCPADQFAATTTMCRAARGVCDLTETCSGTNADCPADLRTNVICRASAGPCDVDESCSGNNDDCPVDSFANATTVCRSSAGVCDVADRCSGSEAACPADVKSTASCRSPVGTCDVGESCDGLNDFCPPDAWAQANSEVCSPYRCTGSSTSCTSGTCANDAACAIGAFCRGGVCVRGKRVFVTSSSHAGTSLGGLAGADAICAARATAAGINGTFKAWLSTSTVSASSRLTHATVPYFRRSVNTVVRLAQHWTELTSATTGVPGIISFDENGSSVTARVWTGTSVSGASSAPTCSEWTSNGSAGRQGSTQNEDIGWWSDQGTAACSNTNRLYCFEQ